jgi:hypothetical protein
LIDKNTDQVWLDTLSGKPANDNDIELIQQASGLRQAILEHNNSKPSSDIEIEESLQKLKEILDKNDDQEWLEALSGKLNIDGKSDVMMHSTPLRLAIQRNDAVFFSSDANTELSLQKLKFRLRGEGLIVTSRHSTLNKRFFQLAIAASVVVTVGFVMRTHLDQQLSLNESEIMQVRGSSNAQIVLATDPEERLRQLSTELDNLGIKYQIERKADSILLKIYGVDLTKEDIVDFMEKNHIKYPMNDMVELDIRSMPIP